MPPITETHWDWQHQCWMQNHDHHRTAAGVAERRARQAGGRGVSISATREQRRQLERDSSKFPATLQPVNRSEWPADVRDSPHGPIRVWRSRSFLVQGFATGRSDTILRLSICRSVLNGDRWQDGISWEDLQTIKAECGYGDSDAVEIFPVDGDIVNVANMRHLWIMAEPVPFAWRSKP